MCVRLLLSPRRRPARPYSCDCCSSPVADRQGLTRVTVALPPAPTGKALLMSARPDAMRLPCALDSSDWRSVCTHSHSSTCHSRTCASSPTRALATKHQTTRCDARQVRARDEKHLFLCGRAPLPPPPPHAPEGQLPASSSPPSSSLPPPASPPAVDRITCDFCGSRYAYPEATPAECSKCRKRLARFALS